jgi:hypothetical protein
MLSILANMRDINLEHRQELISAQHDEVRQPLSRDRNEGQYTPHSPDSVSVKWTR